MLASELCCTLKTDSRPSLGLQYSEYIQGGGASEQLGGRGEHAKPAPLGGSGGMLPQENFEFARSEIESGAIWRHLKPSTHIVKLSNLLVLEQRTRSRVRRCMRATVNVTVRLQQ